LIDSAPDRLDRERAKMIVKAGARFDKSPPLRLPIEASIGELVGDELYRFKAVFQRFHQESNRLEAPIVPARSAR
jgi:hypothetical protein